MLPNQIQKGHQNLEYPFNQGLVLLQDNSKELMCQLKLLLGLQNIWKSLSCSNTLLYSAQCAQCALHIICTNIWLFPRFLSHYSTTLSNAVCVHFIKYYSLSDLKIIISDVHIPRL